MWKRTTVVAATLLFIALDAGAQPTSTHPDSTMAPGSGNSGSANNGVGTSGSLNKQAGTASSSVKDMGGTAQLGNKASPTDKPSGDASSGDTKLETDPSQGGGKQEH
jgi:hypothetical protein